MEDYSVQVFRNHVTGQVSRILWTDAHGRRSSRIGPAESIFDEVTGKIKTELYCLEDDLHRENGPAVRCFDHLGRLVSETWSLRNNRHRDENEGPALRRFDPQSDQVIEECFYWEDKLHATRGPSIKVYDPKTGNLKKAIWTQHGQHTISEHGSVIEYDPNSGVAIEEKFLIGSKLQYRVGHIAKLRRDGATGEITERLFYDGSDFVPVKERLDPNDPTNHLHPSI